MTALLEKALEKIGALSREEQDALASQILDSLEDEEGWKQRFAARGSRLRELAEEALAQDETGGTRPLDDLL